MAGNFIGLNYATNNFLGLGETLSFQTEWGTYQKLYSFGFTEPYVFDRAMTLGFTVYRSDYRYDQLRQLAYAYGVNPTQLASSTYGQYYAQNFEQNSAGFTVFSSYPLRRSFARVGLTYSYSYSSMQAFNAASSSFFESLNFRGLAGPSALIGIISSSIMPTYLYNTINDAWNPTRGKYISANLGILGIGRQRLYGNPCPRIQVLPSRTQRAYREARCLRNARLGFNDPRVRRPRSPAIFAVLHGRRI